jgi:hypothetical protein
MSLLETHLHSQLALACAARLIEDLSEVGIAHCGVGRTQDRVIERVFGFQAQLQTHPFVHIGEQEFLIHGQIAGEGKRSPDSAGERLLTGRRVPTKTESASESAGKITGDSLRLQFLLYAPQESEKYRA